MTAEIQGKAAILLVQNSQSKLKELIHPIKTLDTQAKVPRAGGLRWMIKNCCESFQNNGLLYRISEGLDSQEG